MAMKITAEHLSHLRACIVPLDTPESRQMYLDRIPPNTQHLMPKRLTVRYRWDLLNYGVGSTWVAKHLYPYLNDNHIDTALISLVPPLQE